MAGKRKPRRQRRTVIPKNELPALYEARNFLPGGARPPDRAFAMSYEDLAEAFECTEEAAAAACAKARGLYVSGRIVQVGSRFVYAAGLGG